MGINAGAIKGAKKETNFADKQEDLEGVYPSRLVQVIDLGLQPQRAYKGEDKKPAHEVHFTFELCDTFMVDKDGNDIEDKPRWASTSLPLYPLFADRAKSTKLANAIDPDQKLQGNFGEMLGMPLNVEISTDHKGDKTYVNILGFTKMREKDAAKLEELKNPTKVFDLDNPDVEVFNSLPDWLQKKIKGNLGYAHSKLSALLGDEGAGKPEPREEKKDLPEDKDDAENGQDEQGNKDDMPW